MTSKKASIFLMAVLLGTGICLGGCNALADFVNTSWPTTGQFISISDKSIPVPVIEYAKTILQGDLGTWRARDDSPTIDNVIWLFDKDNNALVFWVKPYEWTRLNTSSSLGVVGDVTHADKAILTDSVALVKFMRLFSCIYRGYDGIALTNAMYQRTAEGREGLPKLESLYGEIINVLDDQFTLKVNLLTSRGAVDQWNVSGKIKTEGKLQFTDVIVKQIYAEKAFTYSIYGGFW